MIFFKYNLNVKIILLEYSELDRSWGLRNTVDPFVRLYYIAQGSGRVVCGDQDIALRQGRFYLLPSQTALTFWTNRTIHIFWSHLELTLQPGIDLFSLIGGTVMELAEPPCGIVEKFQSLHRSDCDALYENLACQALLSEIIVLFLEKYQVELPVRITDLKRFETVIDLIEKSPGARWQVSELAAHAGLSRARFSMEFKQIYGIPPAKFVMRKRLERVRHLLLETDRTLDDIAAESGFHDAFHLSKAFKAETGMPPRNFRLSRRRNLP